MITTITIDKFKYDETTDVHYIATSSSTVTAPNTLNVECSSNNTINIECSSNNGVSLPVIIPLFDV